MTQVPKIVYDRLGAAERSAGRVHPDADFLAAFAEQSLSVPERNSVLEHLALCGECREVVALALPLQDLVAAAEDQTELVSATSKVAQSGARTKSMFSWPSLRWAALTAGIAVAASFLLLHPSKQGQSTQPIARTQIEVTNTTPSTTASRSNPGTETATSSTVNATIAANTVQPRGGRSQSQSSRLPKAGQNRPLESQPMALAGNSKQPPLDRNSSSNSAAFDASASGNHAVTESVEVSGSSPSAGLTPSPESNLLAEMEPPAIEKAKPVPSEIELQANTRQLTSVTPPAAQSEAKSETRLEAKSTIARPQALAPLTTNTATGVSWVITAGVLQRSLDQGQSWQNSLRANQPLLCYASQGQDVWAGGKAGALFHSIDGGLTWMQIQPSVTAQSLSADITRLAFGRENLTPGSSASPQILLVTSSNEIWTSADAGKTWNKK